MSVKNELPAHVKIFSSVMTLLGVALISPLGLLIQRWLESKNQWLFSSLLAFSGLGFILLNIIHARWYIEERKKKNV
ncbi:MAG: hypothetical protein HRT47_09655 [Candidatus Caenarcaniphilales bacterium]|nr:hypothetical protein [Candidatus Caenarcaniphilales bacterium]